MVGAFGKRYRGWAQWTHFSVPWPPRLTTPQRAAHLACFRSCWWTCAHPQVCSGLDEEVHFYCIVASWWLPPPPAGLLAFISYKVWVHPLRGNFCFWTTEFSICSGKISYEKEEANKWSSRMPCSHSAWCRGLGGSEALCFHPLVGSHCFSGGQFTCLPTSRLAAEVSMQPVCEHACMLEVCGSLPDLLFGHYWVRSQQPWRPFIGSISFRALIFTNCGLKLASWIQMLLWITNYKGCIVFLIL